MNLFTLLTDRRLEILAKCREKMVDVIGSKSTSHQLEQGLPNLYEELVEVLRMSQEDTSADARLRFVNDIVTASASRKYAQESYRLGFTVSQLVHGYGCICQGITEYAHEAGEPITATEFSQLNLSLDVAIAQAVSEYETLSLAEASREESLRLGFLAHEIRNFLTSAIMAHELIRRGGVGAAGATSAILTNAHQSMRTIIDRAMAQVRFHGDPAVNLIPLQLFTLISEIESSALPEANEKLLTIIVDADSKIVVNGDRHLLISAMANLIQNAIKFTRIGGTIWFRAKMDGDHVIIEVEDQCGGLPKGQTEELFTPYAQRDTNRTGLGLGLPIARHAVELNNGTLNAFDKPGIGCIFRIRLPAYVPTIESIPMEC